MATDEVRSATAHAVLRGSALEALYQSRMGRESQIIIAAEVGVFPAVQANDRALSRIQR